MLSGLVDGSVSNAVLCWIYLTAYYRYHSTSNCWRLRRVRAFSAALDKFRLRGKQYGKPRCTMRNFSRTCIQALTSYINTAIKGVHKNYHQELLSLCHSVTKEQVLEMMEKYLLPVFKAESSVAVVVSPPGKVDELTEVSIKNNRATSLLNVF